MTRLGRPRLDNPKRNRITLRFDDEEFRKLKERARRSNLTITETVRKGVEYMLASKP